MTRGIPETQSKRRNLLSETSAGCLLLYPSSPLFRFLGGEKLFPVSNLELLDYSKSQRKRAFILLQNALLVTSERLSSQFYDRLVCVEVVCLDFKILAADEKTDLAFPEKVPRRLHLHPCHWVGIGVRLHVLKLEMLHKRIRLGGGKRVVEEGAQVFDDLPLVLLHLLKPDKLDILFLFHLPARKNVVPIVPINLQK